MRNVHVAHFEAGPLAIQTARAERRQSPFVREHRERIRLIHNLRQLAATEEVFDGCRDALRIDQASRRHVLDVFEAHPLLHRATKLQESFPHFVRRQFVDRSQPPVAQVVDIVHVHVAFAGHQPHQILDRVDEVFRPQDHFVFGHPETNLRLMRNRPTRPSR